MSDDLFLELTPKEAAQLVRSTGRQSTGLCFALNSYENRVFEMELVGGERIVSKFYRPGRWTREQIQDEHDFLLELAAEEFPVAEPLESPDGETLFEVSGNFLRRVSQGARPLAGRFLPQRFHQAR